MIDDNSIGNTYQCIHARNESGNTVIDAHSAPGGCARDFDQCDQTEDACAIHS